MSDFRKRPSKKNEDLDLRKDALDDSMEWYDWFADQASVLNPLRYLPDGLTGVAALGGITVGAAATIGGLFYLRSQYQNDLNERREHFQKERERYEQAMENKRKVSERRALEKKDGPRGGKKAGGKKAVSVGSKGGADKKKAAPAAAPKQPAQKNYATMDITDLFSLPMEDIVNVLKESAKAIEKELANLTSLQPSVKNPSQYRRTVMRNHSICQQLNVSAEKFATLSLQFRVEAAQWLSLYTQSKYFDLTARGLKKTEVTSDNQMILYYLSFTPEQLEQLTESQRHLIYKIKLDVAQVLDDIKLIAEAFNYLYNHPRLDTSGKAVVSAKAGGKGAASAIDDDETGQLTYNQLSDEQKSKLQTSIDIYTIMALMPIAALLGQWSKFKTLCEDYMVYTPGTNSLDTWQRSFTALPTTPNINILYHFATTFRPILEQGENKVSIELDRVPTLSQDPTEEEQAEFDRLVEEDLQLRYETFIEKIPYSISLPPPVDNLPLVSQIQQPIEDPLQLTFREYHIRSSIADLVPERSYHHFRANLVNYRSTIASGTAVPRLYAAGEKRIVVRGAVAALQDINAGSSHFHFGPYVPGVRDYVFTSETTKVISNTTCTQNVVVVVTQSEEDVHGKSTWTGYMRVTQTPVAQSKALFSFYFDIVLETSRVLSPEEKKRSDEALVLERQAEEKAKAEAEAKALEAAEQAEKKAEVEGDVTNAEDVPAEEQAKVEEEPTAVEEEEPSPVVEEEPQPVTEEEEPSPVVEEEPTAAVEEPQPVVEDEEPSPVVEEEPEPAVEEASTPVVEEEPEPTPVEDEEPVVEEEPVAVVEDEEPVAEEEASTPVVEEEPSPVAEEEPEPVVEEEPVAVVEDEEPVAEEEEPTPVVEEEPSPVAEEEPEPVVEEEPAAVVEDEEPVAEEEPSPAVEEEPEPVAEEEEPAPVVEEEPEPVVEEEPAEESPTVDLTASALTDEERDVQIADDAE